MQRSVFGLFTALLGVLCVLSAIPAFRKKRYGLAVFLFLKCFY
ncbi:Putative membrane associated protein [Streptococcus thermophilus CNCM I-1630]|nr:Putative membrane associated protein [Streptococcus thermophilus CNCM I-1630]